MTCPGDRRDEDAVAIARKVAGHFDTYICHRDDNLRDRGPDEIPMLLKDALIAEGSNQTRSASSGRKTRPWMRRLEQAQPDDLVLYFARRSRAAGSRSCTSNRNSPRRAGARREASGSIRRSRWFRSHVG